MPSVRFLLSTTACLLAGAAHAFQPLLTDDTGTQGAGGNQLELSYNEDQATQAGATVRTRSVPVVYTRGLSDAFDAFIQANEGGSGNPSFGFKWRFHESEKSGTSLALKPEMRISINSRGEPSRAQERTTVGLTAILTQELSFGAVHANLFANRDRFRDQRLFPDIHRTRLSVAPVWDVAEKWKLAVDLGREHSTSAGTTTRADIAEIGAIHSPSKDLDIAAGLVHRLTDDTPQTRTLSATIGITWRFR